LQLTRSRNEELTHAGDAVVPMTASLHARRFPTSTGLLLGRGLGGFFDGVVLHQILQWHHMLGSMYPADSAAALQLNTFWDGLFHASTYVFVGWA